MAGMSEVGRLFNDNQLIVAEVLQSAGVMKAAVAHLEQYMEKTDNSAGKGKMVLATVKGDVHDIGKNLVDIILSNNGYKVVDLGIKVTPAQLIEAIRAEQPDFVGLSGLLVKSAQQMVLTAQDFKAAGIDIPILVGGAALSKRFTETKISAEYDGPVIYSKDAMQGLEQANRLMDPNEREVLVQELHEAREKRLLADEKRAALPVKEVTEKESSLHFRSTCVYSERFKHACIKKLFRFSSTTLCEYAHVDWPPFRAKRKRKH